MFQTQNKDFTLISHVVYCVAVLSSKVIGTTLLLTHSFAEIFFPAGTKD